jgi:CRISPR/Cas system-associated endoribonuclease Cas2
LSVINAHWWRRYVSWIQNLVFEKESLEVKLKELQVKVRKLMKNEDNLIIFRNWEQCWPGKEVKGKRKEPCR